jgi:cyclic beta-1,2-glucan synthetase
MQQIITVAGPTVLLLGLVIYISVLSVARDKSGLIEEYGKNTGVDDPGEQMRNAAYHHNASRKYKCKKGLFKRHRKCIANLRRCHRLLRDVPEKLIGLVPAAQWLVDNYYVINRESRMIRESYNIRYCRKTPILKGGAFDGYPRIYAIAREILRVTDFHCNEEDVITCLNEYQTVKSLTIAELWAFQNALKLNLIECINAIADDIMASLKVKQDVDRVIEEIVSRGFPDTEGFIEKLKQKLGKEAITNPNYISHILYQLKELDIDDRAFKQWIGDMQGSNDMEMSEIIRRESQYQAALQVKMSSAFTSLIEIAGIDWEGVFEKVSLIEKTFAQDPSGVYEKMDFSTRDAYHHEVEIIARETETEETEVAKKALGLCREAAKQSRRSIHSHVGYYLIGKGRNTLRKNLAYRPGILGKIRDWFREHKGIPYFFGVFILAILITIAGVMLSLRGAGRDKPVTVILMAFFLSILAMTISVEVVNYLATKFNKATKLPSMDFEKGIPNEYRTVVVMPVLLGNKEKVDKYVEDMETYYLANRDNNLCLAILGDFNDADSRELPGDREILEHAVYKIKTLNEKYIREDGSRPFLFLNRYRQWNEKQRCWMGWERKRGKLEEFNRLIAGEENTSFSTIEGDTSVIRSFRYVITIDSDTELTKSKAAKLVGIMAHPLNRPVLNKRGTAVIDGYALLQPRIGVRMHYAMASFFSMVFSGQAGVNPYVYAVSDVYQDNFTEGIFAGKGIYDAKVMYRVLNKRFPDNSVLSHDLLEGSLVRCALASDVELMDGFPSSVISFYKREHRWTRGDWQLLPWIFGRDSLNALSRWKMLDNLRRSLVPVAQFAFIILAMTALDWGFVYWGPVVLFGMLFSLAVNIGRTTLLRFRHSETGTFVSNLLGNTLMTAAQGILLFTLVPYRAYISADAIIRTLYRLYVSKRNLLEWTTAEASEKKAKGSLTSYITAIWPGPVSAVILAAVSPNRGDIFLAITALLWFTSPLAAYFASRPRKKRKKTLGDEQVKDLYMIARKTWRYFEEFFSERENWISPDNYQVYPGNAAANRASPTNIGFQLVSVLSANDLGFIGVTDTIDRIEKVFDTVRKMEKWNGHLYNWYNTRNLEILNPRYVSTVDSCNFAACLIALKEGLRNLPDKPLFCEKVFRGVKAAAELAGVDMPGGFPSSCAGWKSFLAHFLDEHNENPAKAWVDNEWLEPLRKQCRSYLDDFTGFEVEDNDHAPPTVRELAGQGVRKAEEILRRIESITGYIRHLIANMDFSLLYDAKRNLFRVGFNISANSPDNSYYDLLASESRLAGFVAIAKGDVPVKHWFKLGRPLTLVHGAATLISWSGTMFEYLLPNLFLRQVPNTILRQTNINAIRKQIEYARIRKVPWGISESGYYRFDINLYYQYRAFGIPELGFRSDLRKSLVISPYSSLLALADVPRSVYKNLQHLRKFGAEGRYGFYEALDFMSPNVQKGGKKYKLIQSYMIHHQGMSLVSLNNFLNDGVMIERFHSDPMVRGTEVILEECKPYGIIIRKEPEKPVVLRPYQYSGKGYESRVVQTTRPKYPVAHILSNNRYTVMLTSNGEGFSVLNNRAINRWRPISNGESYGMFFYIRDTVTRKYWSAAFQPTMAEPDEYQVTFLPDRVEYRRVDGHIETRTEVTVSPQ